MTPREAADPPPHSTRWPDSLREAGEIGQRMYDLEWSATSLGSIEAWPQSLRSAVRILLTSRFSMWMGWGPDLAFLYNDAYRRDTLGKKHPWALGRPARQVWAEIWPEIGPRIQTVLETGKATWDDSLLLFLERSGYREETYHTFSYSPLTDNEGRMAGMFCVVMEETERVIGERRLASLQDLASQLASTSTEAEVVAAIERSVGANAKDLAFTLLYLFEQDGKRARLASRTGIERDHAAAAPIVGTDDGGALWPAAELLARVAPVPVEHLAGRIGALPCGAWDRAPEQAIVVPVAQRGQDRPAGFLVAGINPYRVFDASYAGFVDLVAGQIASSLANARAYEEERKRAESLAELDRAKTAFFSNVSHEFRTPLTLMLSPLERLLESDEEHLPADARRELELVRRNSVRLLRLVNTLLDFSRIEAGRAQALYEPTDLSAFTAELASTFRSAIEHAGLRLVIDTPPLREPVYVDREMWEKIVLNFLSNAFKFTMEGEIVVSVRELDGAVELAVRDTGPGIPAEELPHLFERFHRVRGTRGRTHEGTGIGLALVQELVRLHGGDVSAESTPGVVTTFRARIPTGTAHLPGDRVGSRHEPAHATVGATPFVEDALRWLPQTPGSDDDDELSPAGVQERRSALPRKNGSIGSVLLADDNADMRHYVTRLLEQESYTVDAVANGSDGLAAARARAPDLILTDVMMPVMDGFELLREVRADPRTREIPVILLSARAGEDERVAGIGAGADDYLVKPFSARELVARVAAHLAMSRLRRDAQMALRESEERLRLALESAELGSWELDLGTHQAPVRSLRHDQIFGYSELLGEWSYERFMEHVHPDDRADVDGSFRNALASGSVWDFQCRIHRVDGALRWIWARGGVYRDGEGNPVRALGIVSDITERKQGEADRQRLTAELQIERSRLQEIFLRAPAVIATLRGPHHIFESVNPAYLQIVGNRDVIGKTIAEVLPEVVEQGFVELLDRVYQTGEPFVASEMRVLLDRREFGTQEEVYFNFVYEPLRAADGSVTGVFVHAIDVTDQVHGRQQVEEQARALGKLQKQTEAINDELQRTNVDLREKTREAEAANLAKSEFLATMSHELRTPLNAVIGYVELLELGIAGAVTEGQRAQLDRIRQSGRHLLGLIEDILDLAKADAGRMHVAQESRQVAEVVKAALSLVEPQAERRGVLVRDECSLGPGLAYVGDEERVRQILANLLSNAVKFTDRGGEVRIRCGGTDTLEMAAQPAGAGAWTGIQVVDTGIGIAAGDLENIFRPFVQLEGGRTRRRGGTGLGLTISRQFARLMDGDLVVESRVGMGSTFTLWLPRETRSSPPSPDETVLAEGRHVGAPRGVAKVGEALRESIDSIVNALVDRIAAEKAIPMARSLRRGDVEDHASAFLADIAQGLIALGESDYDLPDLLRDGTEIQRVISELHGAQRARLGWSEDSLRREFDILREEVERAVRGKISERVNLEDAVAMLERFLEHAERISLRGLRRSLAARSS